jgi:hypothetical protein
MFNVNLIMKVPKDYKSSGTGKRRRNTVGLQIKQNCKEIPQDYKSSGTVVL